jgi:hypothetical protein
MGRANERERGRIARDGATMQAMNTEKKYSFGQKAQTSLNQRPVSQPTYAKKSPGPVKTLKSGAIQVTIWENENLTPEGKVQLYKTVSFERRYKDKNGEWKSTNSLKANDLPKAALLLSKAYEYLILTGEDNDENY